MIHQNQIHNEVGPLPHYPMIPPPRPPQESPPPASPPVTEPAVVAHPQPTIYLQTKQTWEYKTVVIASSESAASVEKKLNAMGAEGWMLCSVLALESSIHYYFKRNPQGKG